MTEAATERAAVAGCEVLRLREALAAAEVELERAWVGMHEAGVPLTRVADAFCARLREHGGRVEKGDGMSAWTIRNVLDSGRHRS